MPETHADRSRAARIRLKLKQYMEVAPEDLAWLEAYEARTKGADMGASVAASREVTYTERETAAAAVGTGAAAETAAGAAMLVREEGKRLDTILSLGMNCLVRSVETYERMVKQLLAEREQDAKLQRTLLESVRTHYVARAEAEADLIHAEAEAAADHQGDGQNGAEKMFVRALVDRFVPKIDAEQPAGNSNPSRE